MRNNNSRVRAAVLAATLTAGVGGAIWMSGPASAQTDDTDIVGTTIVDSSDDSTAVDDGTTSFDDGTTADAAAEGCDDGGSGRGRRDGSSPSSTAETPATNPSETETTVDSGSL